ncbi:MAG: universal stress protein [Planctomycetota bacterium]
MAFKHLGVFLHDAPPDDAVLAFAAVLAERGNATSLACVYVRESEHSPDPDPPAFEAAVRRRLPPGLAARTRMQVEPGTGVAQILRAAREFDFDLLLVGRRLPRSDYDLGAAFHRLARKAPCSVLVVPQGATPRFDCALVGVDFSDHARRALAAALDLARAAGGPQPRLIIFANSPIGYGYHAKLGLSFEAAAAQRAQSLCDELRQYIADADTAGVRLELVATTADRTETAIQEAALAHGAALVVLGSRGATMASLLGSVAERVVHAGVMPVLIVKAQGETHPILDALFGAA